MNEPRKPIKNMLVLGANCVASLFSQRPVPPFLFRELDLVDLLYALLILAI